VIKRAPWGHSTTRNDPIYPESAGAVCGGHGRANAWDNGLSARLETQRRRELNKPSRTETGDDLPHDDFGDHSLDRSLARTLPLRRERSDHMALVQLADGADLFDFKPNVQCRLLSQSRHPDRGAYVGFRGLSGLRNLRASRPLLTQTGSREGRLANTPHPAPVEAHPHCTRGPCWPRRADN
jgi:hypothetical protein